MNAKVTIIDETVVGIGRGRDGARPSRTVGHRLEVFDAAAHAVVLHHDVRRAARPQHRAVLGVVHHRPDTGGGLHERLVAVKVVQGSEVSRRGRRGRGVGD